MFTLTKGVGPTTAQAFVTQVSYINVEKYL